MPAVIAALFALGIAIAAGLYVRRARRSIARREIEIRQDARDAQELLGVAREFALACRISTREVRRSLDEAIRSRIPAVDALAYFSVRNQRLTCVYATPGSRLERYEGLADYEFSADATPLALPVAAALGKETLVSRPELARIHPGDQYAVAIPFLLDKGNVSVLYVASATDAFLEAVPAIELLASHAEPSLVIAEERESMASLTMHDAKTGLLQENPFRERLFEEVARADRTGSSMALVYVDLDGFKAWNDTYGHTSGDFVITRVGELLDGLRLGARDIVARLHGDEFVIAFMDVDKNAAVARAKEIGAAIYFDDRQSLLPPDATGEPLSLSASIGVALFPRDARSAEDLLERADELMYEVKRAEKDRVAFYDDDGTVGMIQSSTSDRRDPGSRPDGDRRQSTREFRTAAGGA